MPHKTVIYDLKENFSDYRLFFLQCQFYSAQNVSIISIPCKSRKHHDVTCREIQM